MKTRGVHDILIHNEIDALVPHGPGYFEAGLDQAGFQVCGSQQLNLFTIQIMTIANDVQADPLHVNNFTSPTLCNLKEKEERKIPNSSVNLLYRMALFRVNPASASYCSCAAKTPLSSGLVFAPPNL